MKAIVNTGPDRVELLDQALPEPGLGQVRIRTGVVGICVTDLEMIAGWDRTGFPATPGHEWAGRVDAVGPGGDRLLVGKKCVAENVLADGGEVGFEHPGAYGQFFLTESANLHLLPDDFPLSSAALIEPLAVTVRACNRLSPDPAQPVLIFGDGPIGLLLLAVLKHSGVREVVMIGGRAQRLETARQFGAKLASDFHSFGSDPAQGITQELGQFPAVVEASGSPQAMRCALHVAGKGARVLLLGDYRDACADFPWNHILHRELTLLGSNASAGGWKRAVELAVGGLPLQKLVTHRLSVASFADGIALTRQKPDDMIKVVLDY